MSDHDEIMRSLGQIEGTQGAILKHLGTVDLRLNAHAKKIEKLGLYGAWQAGAEAVLGAIAVLIGRKFI